MGVTGSAGPPCWGLDEDAFRFLELHETRAHALGGRRIRDLGDAVLLFSPRDREPFFNRLAAVRWPDDRDSFDRRLAEAIALFAGLDRRPHVWTPSAFGRPADLRARLVAHGFSDTDGGYIMVLVHPPAAGRDPVGPGGDPAEPGWTAPPDVSLERLDGGPEVTLRPGTLREISTVLAASFGVDRDQLASIEAETATAFRSADFHICLARSGGTAVAIAKRYTFDGATYLSSIGTVPGQRGRGLGSLVTDAVIRDALAESPGPVYLGVHAHNDRAIELYLQAGFEIAGGRTGDLLLL